ncbi:period circadian protein homolog 1b isoform X2 [Scleropages formosus]|uniref:Period circadian clock 1b n=1 Tax=Scleropages formosus TaxID=113540 RepID=A0A8C9S621_SCLFO|nr:period circadian protein homolog 1 isoform X2 [Scleropages formosus]
MSVDNSDPTPRSNPQRSEGGAEEEAGHAASSGSDSGETGASPRGATGVQGLARDAAGAHSDDMDALSSGNDSGERESEGGMGRGGVSRGRQSTRSSQSSSSHNGKDSGMLLETTESNKSSNSQSPSPPSSSAAYSLLSASSEQDHPSTSGCSSDQSARVQTQKALRKALRELKIRVPADRKGRSGTLEALKYALNCVKQVRANQEYYHQWSVEESHSCSLDLSTFTVEELDNISSEYTLKNTDTFSMAVSFLSGKVVYVSPQGSSLLRCKPDSLQGALFSELLAPQDINTFYSNTAPCRLPMWSACMGSGTSPVDCTQEKSMFCRISGGRVHQGEMRYYPFRLTPYQLTLRDSDMAAAQPCCLLIAERVHSGYEAPRIPPDKRVFTTSHTPSCLFQEVDERAVPLLGYLPQDLVGTPVLLYLHPEDRPIMVAIHKKILQFAGQPFEHSPLRMCARSGEYLTIDTSWSSFVNPWSRKVAFIVGRHKVRTSPLNEDVFSPPQGGEGRAMIPQIHQLSEQIHRILMQPVHASGSQGYHSLGSNGSQEQHLSAASSSDTAAEDTVQLRKPMTFQQICKDVHMVKTNGQQVFIESRNRPPPRKHGAGGAAGALRASEAARPAGDEKEPVPPPKSTGPVEPVRKETPTTYSYQQINCLDSIIRYLESCNVPSTVKRKCGSSSCTVSSTSDDDKQKETSVSNKGTPVALGADGTPLPPLTLHSKTESVASITSQCSFSSTIVHVGDKKPPESDIVMEEAPPTPTQAPPPLPPPPPPMAQTPAAPPSPAPPTADAWRGGAGRLGLTKEVLSAHTQQEEQAFLSRFRDLSQLRVFDPSSAPQRRHTTMPFAKGVRSSRDYPAGGSSGRRRGRGGKRLKHQKTSDHSSSLGIEGAAAGRLGAAGTNPKGPVPQAPPMVPGAPTSSSSWPASVGSQASLAAVPHPPGVVPLYPFYPPPLPQPVPPSAPDSLQSGLRYPLQPPPSVVPPMVAFVVPNYMFPQLSSSIPSLPQPFYTPSPGFSYPASAPIPPAAPQTPTLPAQTPCAPSRSSTPQSCSQPPIEREGAESPLFQSRCSSPLNLLQLEESPSNRQEAQSALTAVQQATPPVGGAAQDWTAKQGGGAVAQALPNRGNEPRDSKENENGETNESNQDAMSTSSDLLDLLLQEDSQSGTGSAASGSGFSGSGSGSSGSGSNGCSTTGSGTRSSQSSHTSKYFGSVDSSENDHTRRQPTGGPGEEQFIKYVLQDPIWLLMANTDEEVMMTYQLPIRDVETVLREDREALRAMQKQQPCFTESQKKELSQVHPWIRTGRLPRAINVSACVGCESHPSVQETAPFDVEIHDMELGSVLETSKETALSVTPMEEELQARAVTQANDQEMSTEEQEVASHTKEDKGLDRTAAGN